MVAMEITYIRETPRTTCKKNIGGYYTYMYIGVSVLIGNSA